VPRIAAIAVLLLSCATSGDRPAPRAGHVVSPAAEGEPEIVRIGKVYKIGYPEALGRYSKGARCNGSDAPETVIGEPDQRNQVQVARDRIVTYGFRFRGATLFIRCRGNLVETARLLK
jgi:hypothetical protein